MEIYILRHGEAAPRDPAIPDENRKLTAKGKRDVRNVVTAASNAKVAPQLILTSPLTRARETATIAAAVFGNCPIAVTEHLRPEANPASIWREVCAKPKVSRVVLVGHEPHLSHLIAYLLDVSLSVDLKKGALVRIDSAERDTPPRGTLKWMFTPRLAGAL
jgi:phosphohistidine phosphatase